MDRARATDRGETRVEALPASRLLCSSSRPKSDRALLTSSLSDGVADNLDAVSSLTAEAWEQPDGSPSPRTAARRRERACFIKILLSSVVTNIDENRGPRLYIFEIFLEGFRQFVLDGRTAGWYNIVSWR